MTLRWIGFYIRALIVNVISTKALNAVLSVFGALWLFVEVTTYFFPTVIVFGTTKLPDAIRSNWPYFLAFGILLALWQCKPRLAISHKLRGRDVVIEIATGDIFSLPGAVIIGSNTTFDTRVPTIISAQSIQGLFFKRYYSGEEQLVAEISAGLHGVQSHELSSNRVGNSKRYPFGTCVRLRPKERTGYLLAIAHINEHGTASGSFEDLKNSLARLWEHIGTRGFKEPLLIPVLGTGFTRLPQCREEIVQEIIKSFVAACSERTFTDKLTIVISPSDILNHNISLEELGDSHQYRSRGTKSVARFKVSPRIAVR